MVVPRLAPILEIWLLTIVYVELDFEKSSVSADDKDQTSEGRKARNLSFKSPLTSLSGLLGFRLGLLKKKGLVLPEE